VQDLPAAWLVVVGSEKVSDARTEGQGGIVSPERRLEIFQSLRSFNCDGCGCPKKTMQSLCGKCYYKLPKTLQSNLYRKFGDGYEAAFEQALEFIKLRMAK
jgi:hypothetical protein